eukprot:COSAG01_NODE_6809_length_3487_cov_8.018890_1_plen_190_part_10
MIRHREYATLLLDDDRTRRLQDRTPSISRSRHDITTCSARKMRVHCQLRQYTDTQPIDRTRFVWVFGCLGVLVSVFNATCTPPTSQRASIPTRALQRRCSASKAACHLISIDGLPLGSLAQQPAARLRHDASSPTHTCGTQRSCPRGQGAGAKPSVGCTKREWAHSASAADAAAAAKPVPGRGRSRRRRR